MKTTLNIEFTEMKKNSKHQVMKFTYKGNDEEGKGQQLYEMAGNICVMEIKGCKVGTFNVDFYEHKKTHNGFVSQVKIKGDVSNENAGEIYAFSGNNVELTIQQSQMSIDEFYDGEHDAEVDEEADEDQQIMELQ